MSDLLLFTIFLIRLGGPGDSEPQYRAHMSYTVESKIVPVDLLLKSPEISLTVSARPQHRGRLFPFVLMALLVRYIISFSKTLGNSNGIYLTQRQELWGRGAGGGFISFHKPGLCGANWKCGNLEYGLSEGSTPSRKTLSSLLPWLLQESQGFYSCRDKKKKTEKGEAVLPSEGRGKPRHSSWER